MRPRGHSFTFATHLPRFHRHDEPHCVSDVVSVSYLLSRDRPLVPSALEHALRSRFDSASPSIVIGKSWEARRRSFTSRVDTESTRTRAEEKRAATNRCSPFATCFRLDRSPLLRSVVLRFRLLNIWRSVAFRGHHFTDNAQDYWFR